MKKKVPKQEKVYLTKQALFLRYGEDQPPIKPPPCPLLSIAEVAKMMKQDYYLVFHLLRQYFKPAWLVGQRSSTLVPTMNTRPQSKVLVSQSNLTPAEHSFLCCQENQISWAHLTL